MDTQASPKILVVEDETPMRRMLSAVLQQANLVVIEAGNGEKGLELALKERPAMIVTDNLMPIMNGVDMIAELRRDTWGATVPVILMTNVNSMEAVNKVLQSGGSTDYVMKGDVQLDQVVAMVRQRLGLA